MKLKSFLNKFGKGDDKFIYLKNNGVQKIKRNFDGTYNCWGKFNGNPNKIKIKINKFYGNFLCPVRGLKTLKGCPKIVEGIFNCRENNLTSLEYGPKIVVGDYSAEKNKLETLNGLAKIIDGTLNIRKNKKQFSKEDVEKISDVKKEIYV